MLQFRHGNIALAPPAAALDSDDAENVRSTSDLLRDHHPAARAELQWRLAVAFSPLMLAMLALPLARQAPRASPAGRVLVGVLAYFIIMNMITLARNFIANGQLAAPLGMWWILLPVFAGAAWVFTQQYAVRTLPARKQIIG